MLLMEPQALMLLLLVLLMLVLSLLLQDTQVPLLVPLRVPTRLPLLVLLVLPAAWQEPEGKGWKVGLRSVSTSTSTSMGTEAATMRGRWRTEAMRCRLEFIKLQ
jgi:hypothetical protein